MKLNKLLRTFTFVAMLGSLAFTAGSCSDKEPEKGPVAIGQVSGVVIDSEGNPLSDVAVTVKGLETTATTAADGSYTLENIPVKLGVVIFTKKDYQTTSITITASKFDAELKATVNPTMAFAAAKIMGTILDAKNNDAPLPGVLVSLSPSQTATSDADGRYLIENLPLEDFTVTFTMENYATVTRKVARTDFNSESIATLDLKMGGAELLRGLTADDLKSAEKWYYNEYKGGRNGQNGGQWDWSTDFMCTLNFIGNWEEQNEGTTLRIRNDEDQQGNPEDLKVFDSFLYGSKKITPDNQILTLRLRTHDADAAAPAHFGVQVIDLNEAQPEAVLIGGVKTYGSGDYGDIEFDLSAYAGKEVVIAIGIFRKQTGDYWKQLVLRRIGFAAEKTSGENWLPGTEVAGLDGWKMTQEMVRSTMPHNNKTFTGISPVGGDRDNYVDGYRSWREGSHIGAQWSLVPVNKDVEPFAGQGFIIKTRGGTAVNTTTPESYFYSKFAIAAGNNRMTFKTRTFHGDTDTFFKVTAITEDGVAKHMDPVSNTATSASKAADGCWRFHNNKGEKGSNDYASFVYDLSEFNGQNVVIAIGVYKGLDNGDESKLCFYSIDFN